MKKIHITLVGGQPAPVYNCIIATKPDKIIYVHSNETQKTVETVRQEIHLPCEQILLSPTDCVEVLALAAKLAKQYEHDEVTVNISGGTKAWSHFFGVIFDRLDNAAVIYMDQNNVLWNYKTMQASTNFKFDMHALFRLYGNKLEHYKPFNGFTAEDDDAIAGIEHIRQFNYTAFNELMSVLDKKKQHQLQSQQYGCFTTKDNNSFVEWEKTNDKQVGFVRISLANNRGKRQEFCHESENITELAFNTSWFEYKVARLLSQWDKAQEISLNNRFTFKQGTDKNEVDIIVNTGTKILFVECKTQINKPTDIDKFGSVVKNYGGLGSKGIFITDSNINDLCVKKCADNKLLHFSLKDAARNNVPIEKLFELLDSELFNINA